MQLLESLSALERFLHGDHLVWRGESGDALEKHRVCTALVRQVLLVASELSAVLPSPDPRLVPAAERFLDVRDRMVEANGVAVEHDENGDGESLACAGRYDVLEHIWGELSTQLDASIAPEADGDDAPAHASVDGVVDSMLRQIVPFMKSRDRFHGVMLVRSLLRGCVGQMVRLHHLERDVSAGVLQAVGAALVDGVP